MGTMTRFTVHGDVPTCPGKHVIRCNGVVVRGADRAPLLFDTYSEASKVVSQLEADNER